MELILDQKIELSLHQNKTNVFIPFRLEDELIEMKIYFSYSPKRVSDREEALEMVEKSVLKYAPGEFRSGYKLSEKYLPVKNLLTLSLDSPAGYVGCAHRQNSTQIHTLSKDECSFGFVPQCLLKGSWQAVINVHSLVTEICSCRIKIYGEN